VPSFLDFNSDIDEENQGIEDEENPLSEELVDDDT